MLGSFLMSPVSCWSKSFWISRTCTRTGLGGRIVVFPGWTEVMSIRNSSLDSRGATALLAKAFWCDKPRMFSNRPTNTALQSSSQSRNINDHQQDGQEAQQPQSLSSKRGRDAPTYLPSYLRDARNVEIYHPTLRPNGAIQLSVAENYMMENWLLPAFRDSTHSLTPFFTSDSIYYQPTQGREDFRRILCNVTLPYILQFHRKTTTTTTTTTTNQRLLNPNNLIIGAGCNAVLENLCLCLASLGEGVMIPTPYYAAFEFDLTCRIGLKIIPVHPYPPLINDKVSISTPTLASYYPTFHSLERAYTLAQESGITPRILLLTHPNNPLGIIYPKSVLEEILNWCLARDVHLISDEIYAGSVYSPPSTQPSTPYTGTTFHSILEILPASSNNKDWRSRVHWIYALSKDFCLSGLRVGMCYTENEEILYPMQKLNDLCQVSSLTQSILTKLLDSSSNSNTADDSFLVSFLTQARHRLQARSLKVQQFLSSLNIPTLPSEAGMFIWMDLQEFLPPSSNRTKDEEERENILYKELVQSGLLFTPGISMKMQLPGFFRCVYTAARNEDEIDLALHRLKIFVDKKRSSFTVLRD